jgi:hypothetical protein
MFSSGSPWTPKRVHLDGIDESTRQFLVTLWNTYSFFVTYANLDGWEPRAADEAASTHVLDRWARSRLHRTVQTVTDALEAYDAFAGSQALEQLVDDLSNWYVRRSRPRFWKSSDPAAHATLHECLTTLTTILAPYCPFLADEMFLNLGQTDRSVHLADWPAADTSAIDNELEAEMSVARTLVSLGRKARNDAKIGVRQPLPRAIALLGRDITLRDDVVHEIADELNVKRFEVVTSLEGLLSYRVAPNFAALGPRVGKRCPSQGAAGDDRRRRRAARVRRVGALRPRRRRSDRASWVRTTSRSAPRNTKSSRSPRTARMRSRSISRSTTTCAPKVPLESSAACSTISRRRRASRSATGSACGITADRSLAQVIDRHRDWIAGEALATELVSVDGAPTAAAETASVAGERIEFGADARLATSGGGGRRRGNRRGRRRLSKKEFSPDASSSRGPSGVSSCTASRKVAKKASSSRTSASSTRRDSGCGAVRSWPRAARTSAAPVCSRSRGRTAPARRSLASTRRARVRVVAFVA